MPGMLTCSSSNGIDGGVNETAVQMMDHLNDFWYGMILRRPGSSTTAVDSGVQRWTALGVSGAPERAGREAGRKRYRYRACCRLVASTAGVSVFTKGFLHVKMGDPCRRVKSIVSQGGRASARRPLASKNVVKRRPSSAGLLRG